jgi:ribonuclease P protein component
MIPKKNRISKDLFEKISKNGKGQSSPFLSIKYLKNQENTTFFATVVSKKVSKVSPKRNLIKRRVNSVLNNHKNNIKQGFFVVFYIKPGALDRSFKQIKKETLDLLIKSELLLKQ